MFHNEDTDDKYVFPVAGVLYKDYGEYKKSNDIQVFNKGVDIIADNEAVKSISEGTVLEVGKDNIYGNYMVIRHGEYLAKYYGLGVINKEINDNVKKGEIIGEIKNTNEKLNFRIEIYKDNKSIDPIDDIEYGDEDILLI
nr:M23 family metallopeptidase [Anaeromonas frigoriresistens]